MVSRRRLRIQLSLYDEKGDLPETVDERMPEEIASREDFKQFVDDYDTSIRYMDDYIGHVFDLLSQMGVFEDTLIIVSSDHGENLGELNVYGDHTTVDEATCRLPLVVHGPEIEPGVDNSFHYQLDLGPTLVELVNQEPAPRWDGRSFATSLTDGEPITRDYLVFGHCAWTCQRSIRFDNWPLIHTYHDAYMDLAPVMLFDIADDPHEATDLTLNRPDIVARGSRVALRVAQRSIAGGGD